MFDLSFYKNKKVFITGHTGFKGTWLTKALLFLGSEVSGFSLNPPTSPSLYELSNVDKKIHSTIDDILHFHNLLQAVKEFQPDIVFHLAAQPIVSIGYSDPRQTYEVNTMGTVNILEAIRKVSSVKSFLNITTDKVYLNKEWIWSYRENEELDGFDPYSNSKSCSELITNTYKRSFFQDTKSSISISTARAGNVIGGGDFSVNRIMPDILKSIMTDSVLEIRNPDSVRPYQHVLESVYAYLLIAGFQYSDSKFSGSYNVGPLSEPYLTTKELLNLYNEYSKIKVKYKFNNDTSFHEAKILKLDSTKMNSIFNWSPVWNIQQSVKAVINWNEAYLNKISIEHIMDEQIAIFFGKLV